MNLIIAKLTEFISKKLGAFCIVIFVIVMNRILNLGLTDEDINTVMQSGLGYIGIQGLADMIKIGRKVVDAKVKPIKTENKEG